MSEKESQQAARAELSEAKAELEGLRAQKQELEKQIESDRLDREIAGQLASAQAVDAEATGLLVRKRLETGSEKDTAKVVGQLVKEKLHLFAKQTGGLPGRTQAVRQHPCEPSSPLKAAARQAASSGTPRDILEYQRARREYRN